MLKGGVVFFSVTASNTFLVNSITEMDDSQDHSDVSGYTNGGQDPGTKVSYHANQVHRISHAPYLAGFT